MSNTPEDTYQPSSEAFNDDYIAFIAEKDIIEKFNRFIWLYANEYYRHLIDSDQNGGEHMRRAITLHTQKAVLVELIEQIENLYLCREISFDTYENELADLDERIDQLTNPTEGSNK